VLDSTPISFDITEENSTEEGSIVLTKVKKPNYAQKGKITIAKEGEVFYGVNVSGGTDDEGNETTSTTTTVAGEGTTTTTTVINNDEELPQTGYSNIYKVIAGFATLMTIGGAALVVKTRKENE
jgi:LPXTG-motif cell wall-anchored protein